MYDLKISAYQPSPKLSGNPSPPSPFPPLHSPRPLSSKSSLPTTLPISSLPSEPSTPPTVPTSLTSQGLTKISPPRDVMAPSLIPTPTLIERIRENPITTNLPQEVEQAQVPWKKAVTLGVGLFFMGLLVGIVSMVFLYQ